MRKIIFKCYSVIIITAIAVLFLGACEKIDDSDLIISTEDNIESQINTNYSLPIDLMSGISVENGILKFENEDISHKVFLFLEKAHNAYQVELYSNYSQEEIDIMVNEGRINLNYVLEEFENQFEYYSLRKTNDLFEREWLKNKELDFSKEPNFIIRDKCIQTMLNSNGEYIIDDIIYKIAENGVIYGINNKDIEALEKLRASLNSAKNGTISLPENIFVAQPNGNAKILPVKGFESNLKSTAELDLKANISKEKIHYYEKDNDDFYLKGRVTITNVIGVSNFVKSETETYEYKGWRGWVRISMHQYAYVAAALYMMDTNGDWTFWETIDDDDWEDDKQAQIKYSTYPYRIRVASGGLQGKFKSDDVTVPITKTVTW